MTRRLDARGAARFLSVPMNSKLSRGLAPMGLIVALAAFTGCATETTPGTEQAKKKAEATQLVDAPVGSHIRQRVKPGTNPSSVSPGASIKITADTDTSVTPVATAQMDKIVNGNGAGK